MALMKKKRECVVRYSSQRLELLIIANYLEACINGGPLHKRQMHKRHIADPCSSPLMYVLSKTLTFVLLLTFYHGGIAYCECDRLLPLTMLRPVFTVCMKALTTS